MPCLPSVSHFAGRSGCRQVQQAFMWTAILLLFVVVVVVKAIKHRARLAMFQKQQGFGSGLDSHYQVWLVQQWHFFDIELTI
jgi:hypothetical protein